MFMFSEILIKFLLIIRGNFCYTKGKIKLVRIAQDYRGNL